MVPSVVEIDVKVVRMLINQAFFDIVAGIPGKECGGLPKFDQDDNAVVIYIVRSIGFGSRIQDSRLRQVILERNCIAFVGRIRVTS